MNRKAMVTGIGVVSDLGTNFPAHAKKLLSLTKGITRETFTNGNQELNAFVGKVTEPVNVPSQYKNSYRNLQFTISAVHEAVNMSGISLTNKKIALVVGTSLGGKTVGQRGLYEYETGNFKKNYATSSQKYLQNVADEVLNYLGIKASVFVISTACSASNNAAILGAQLIQNGKYDVVIAGGTDELADVSLAGFTSLEAINVESSAQPYSSGKGISLGEGAGFVVLESNPEKAKPFAEIIGGAISSDAYHITAPDPRGEGAESVIDGAISQAGVKIGDIDYVNGHGTGTHANDDMEFKLLSNKFNNIATVSSTKALTGHTLGAAGIIELINTIIMMNSGKVVGTLNDAEPIGDSNLSSVFLKNKVTSLNIDYAISLSFAFGGNNSASLIAKPGVYQSTPLKFKKFSDYSLAGSDATSLMDGKLVTPQLSGEYETISANGSELTGNLYKEYKLTEKINPSQYRRYDDFTKMVVKSVARAFKNAGISYKKLTPEKVGLLFSTPNGAIRTVEEIERTIPMQGYSEVSASAFPFTVLNAAAGVVSQAFKIKGPVSVISATGTGFIDIFEYADEIVENSDLEFVVIVNASQISEFDLFGLAELNASTTTHDTDFVTSFIFGGESSGTKILSSKQLKGVGITDDDIEQLVESLTNEARIDKNTIKGFVWNSNRNFDCEGFENLSEYLQGKNCVFDLGELDFSTEGAGEELIYLERNIPTPGLYVVLAYSKFGGISGMLVEK